MPKELTLRQRVEMLRDVLCTLSDLRSALLSYSSTSGFERDEMHTEAMLPCVRAVAELAAEANRLADLVRETLLEQAE